MITDPIFYLAATPAVFLLGLSKGGFSGVGILSMPLIALVIPPVQAAAIMLPVLMAQDVVTVWSYRKTWDKASLTHLVPGALLGIAAGYVFATVVPESVVRVLIGLIAIGFCLDHWVRPSAAGLAARPHDWRSGTILGAASGYTSFVIHVGGPPFNMYTIPRGLDRDTFVGTAAVFFAFVNLVKLPAFLALGQMSIPNLATAAALLPLAIVSNLFGIWLVRRVPAELFYRMIYALTFIVGVALSISGLRSMLIASA
ncbi:MAG: sulfite exporter TauE/SafE family protein [Alphaproteobacteria bacterium]|jgi:uncharacterized membrane protein YfcA